MSSRAVRHLRIISANPNARHLEPFPKVLLRPELAACVIKYDPAGFQNDGPFDDSERGVHALFDNHECRARLPVDVHEPFEHILCDNRSKPRRRLVKQQNARLRHECHAESQHLLLPAA